MTLVADTLPDDPGTLKAMLIAERAASRTARADHQGVAASPLRPPRRDAARGPAAARAGRRRAGRGRRRGCPGETTLRQQRPSVSARRRANRGSLPAHLPRIETLVDIEDKACPCCRNALHVIGEDVAERLDIVPAQFRVLVVRRPQVRLPRLRGRGGPGAGAGPADRGRHSDRGHRRAGARLQVRRPSAALSPGADLRPAGRQSRPLDAGRLGRARRLPAAARPRAAARRI